MNMSWKNSQTRTTPTSYRKIIDMVTNHKNEISNIVNNASKKGYQYPNKKFSQELSTYLTSCIQTELPKYPYFNKHLKYILYGVHLYVFSPKKSRLLDILEIPEEFHMELRILKQAKLGYKKG